MYVLNCKVNQTKIDKQNISNISQPVEICYGGFLKLIYSWFVNSTGPRPQQRLKDSKKIIHILITIFL